MHLSSFKSYVLGRRNGDGLLWQSFHHWRPEPARACHFLSMEGDLTSMIGAASCGEFSPAVVVFSNAFVFKKLPEYVQFYCDVLIFVNAVAGTSPRRIAEPTSVGWPLAGIEYPETSGRHSMNFEEYVDSVNGEYATFCHHAPMPNSRLICLLKTACAFFQCPAK